MVYFENILKKKMDVRYRYFIMKIEIFLIYKDKKLKKNWIICIVILDIIVCIVYRYKIMM